MGSCIKKRSHRKQRRRILAPHFLGSAWGVVGSERSAGHRPAGRGRARALARHPGRLDTYTAGRGAVSIARRGLEAAVVGRCTPHLPTDSPQIPHTLGRAHRKQRRGSEALFDPHLPTFSDQLHTSKRPSERSMAFSRAGVRTQARASRYMRCGEFGEIGSKSRGEQAFMRVRALPTFWGVRGELWGDASRALCDVAQVRNE